MWFLSLVQLGWGCAEFKPGLVAAHPTAAPGLACKSERSPLIISVPWSVAILITAEIHMQFPILKMVFDSNAHDFLWLPFPT